MPLLHLLYSFENNFKLFKFVDEVKSIQADTLGNEMCNRTPKVISFAHGLLLPNCLAKGIFCVTWPRTSHLFPAEPA